MVINVNEQELSKSGNTLPREGDFLSKVQHFLDNNIRVVKNVSWIVGGIGVVIIIRRTYALHHFTNQCKIPETYFTNNITLTGKVVKVHDNGSLGVQHIPLLWPKMCLKWVSEPSSKLLSVKITGIELRNGGWNYLSLLLSDSNVKFKLLGKNNCKNIESIIYKRKGWFRQICINEDVIESGFAVASHVESLSSVKDYNILIERLVKAEIKAVWKKKGIWKEEHSQCGMLCRAWNWFKSKQFKT